MQWERLPLNSEHTFTAIIRDSGLPLVSDRFRIMHHGHTVHTESDHSLRMSFCDVQVRVSMSRTTRREHPVYNKCVEYSTPGTSFSFWFGGPTLLMIFFSFHDFSFPSGHHSFPITGPGGQYPGTWGCSASILHYGDCTN